MNVPQLPRDPGRLPACGQAVAGKAALPRQTAVIDSYLGHRVGLWNPSIYAFATGPRSPFTVLQQAGTGNDNNYYTGNPGQPYNEGSGLGYPDLSQLAADLAGRR